MQRTPKSDAHLLLEPAPETAMLYACGLVQAGHFVVDFGCYRGDDAVYLATAGCRVLGIDVSPISVTYAQGLAFQFDAQRRASFSLGGVERLVPVKRGVVDVLLDRLVLSNLNQRDRKRLIRAAARILRPGGLWVLRYGPPDERVLDGRSAKGPGPAFDRWFRSLEIAVKGDSGEKGDIVWRRSNRVRMPVHPYRTGFSEDMICAILVRTDSDV